MIKKLILLLTLLISTYLYAESTIEFDYEIDAYYSNVSAFIDLDSEHNLTDATDMSEIDIYARLISNTLSPNIFLIEAAVNPMPIAGLYVRDTHPGMYDGSNLQNVNMVKAITAGFEEPYSLSFFLGRMMVFKNDDSERVGKNRAYMGYLASVGGSSIKDNLLHEDRWVNLEFKLKGTREITDSDLDWSFRIGTMIHGNENFTDSIYIGARRSSVDFKQSAWSIIYNSAFSVMLAVSAESYKFTEGEMIIEKKWPLNWTEKASFGLALGYLYSSGEKYSGELKDEGIVNHQFLFRPNFKW